LTAASWRARADNVSQWREAENLCGTVITMPSILRTRFAAAMKASKSGAGTCMGMQTASTPRAANTRVSPAGDFAWSIGSPTIRWMRVAPLSRDSMVLLVVYGALPVGEDTRAD